MSQFGNTWTHSCFLRLINNGLAPFLSIGYSIITMNSQLFNPSYLKELCVQYHLQPSKEYGQNYLLNAAPILAMVKAGAIEKTDTIVEVGPGFGVLTFALLEQAGHIIAFEIEKKIFGYWDALQETHSNLDVRWGNVLREFPVMQHTISGPYKVIANVPYHITALLLRLFLEAEHKPERIVIMVQKEVADRMCAKPGDMSLLSASVQFYGKPKIITKVSKGNFWPQPKVDSAVIAITDIESREDSATFFTLARAGFANKRKQLWRNLADATGIPGPEMQKVLEEVTGDARARAQELSIDQWVKLGSILKI